MSAICTFSATVIEPKVAATWNVRPTPRRQMSPGAMPAVLLPKIVTRPVVGAIWPSIMAKQVLLPAPFGPMSARIFARFQGEAHVADRLKAGI